jgi:hypothetical protein
VAKVTAGVLGVSPGWQDDSLSHPVVEIAIYPDVVELAACSLRARSPIYRTAVCHIRQRRHAEMPHIRWQTSARNHPTPCHSN